MAEEKSALLDTLESQRIHIVGILEGLGSEDLKRIVLPSGWSSLGLVQHLALEVERFWFRVVVAGEVVNDGAERDPASAWDIPSDTTPEMVFRLYQQEIERANAVIAATALEDAPKAWPDFFGTWRLPNLRAVLLHVITETACHAGHLDAVRELIDGRQWVTLT